MELVPEPTSGILNCQETWEKLPQLVYGSFTNVTQFVVPFATIVICYTKIIIRLRQRAKSVPGTRTARQRQEEAARNARVNKMLIAMVVIFASSWFPINLINLIADTVDLSKIFQINVFSSKSLSMNSTWARRPHYWCYVIWFDSIFNFPVCQFVGKCTTWHSS